MLKNMQIGCTAMENKNCNRCGKKLGAEAYDVHTCTPKRDFKFSTIEEAMQPIPTPKVQPQLTDDEARFANAFITLQKAGYGKEAEIILKCKPAWQGLTDEERNFLAWESNNGIHCVQMTEARLKDKNCD